MNVCLVVENLYAVEKHLDLLNVMEVFAHCDVMMYQVELLLLPDQDLQHLREQSVRSDHWSWRWMLQQVSILMVTYSRFLGHLDHCSSIWPIVVLSEQLQALSPAHRDF